MLNQKNVTSSHLEKLTGFELILSLDNYYFIFFRMSSYVDNVKKNVAGQGIVTQIGDSQKDRIKECPPSPPTPVMPPPMKLLPIVTGKYDQRPSSTTPQKLTTSSWSCAGCGQRMGPGEVAIFAERAGQDKCWHPGCFACCECGEILEDLLYYYSYGQLFCGRHFAAKMNIPRCAACDELIFSVEYTAAEDRFCWPPATPSCVSSTRQDWHSTR